MFATEVRILSALADLSAADLGLVASGMDFFFRGVLFAVDGAPREPPVLPPVAEWEGLLLSVRFGAVVLDLVVTGLLPLPPEPCLSLVGAGRLSSLVELKRFTRSCNED